MVATRKATSALQNPAYRPAGISFRSVAINGGQPSQGANSAQELLKLNKILNSISHIAPKPDRDAYRLMPAWSMWSNE